MPAAPTFHALADGLMCPDDKQIGILEGFPANARTLAAQVAPRAPVESFAGIPWPKSQGADLRKFLIQILQQHIEELRHCGESWKRAGFSALLWSQS